MIRTVDFRGRSLTKAAYQSELPRAELNVVDAMRLIEPILERVKNGSESDLLDLAQEFDGVRPSSIRVPGTALASALAELDPAVRTALELSFSQRAEKHESTHFFQEKHGFLLVFFRKNYVLHNFEIYRNGLCAVF